MKKQSTPAVGRMRLCLFVAVLLLLVGLASAWSWSPLRDWLDLDTIVQRLRALGAQYGLGAGIAVFALAVTLAVPLSFLTVVTLVALGPVQGTLCTLAGAMIGAGASYGVGRALGREVVERLGGPRVNAVSQRLAQQGLWAVIAVRVVPVAPFAIINMVAGATRISLRDMLLGTALGMTPGTVIMALFVDQIVEAMRRPSSTTLVILLLTVLLIGGGVVGFRYWLRRNRQG
ncbi:TVP38/TMEM64 family protein [Variovorax sp. HJSM1_2]|uniref:TVP38/TMEM64 family protein n=1 Tax=Variovorax sp. HJSM1_2 TaxID=3366263 RepID=UPI003BE3BF5A